MPYNDKPAQKPEKKSSLKKIFAVSAGALLLGGALAAGGAAAINGVERHDVQGVDAQGRTVALHTLEIKPMFEKQRFETPTYRYWCWSAASIKCPIPVSAQDKPAYDQLRQQTLKK